MIGIRPGARGGLLAAGGLAAVLVVGIPTSVRAGDPPVPVGGIYPVSRGLSERWGWAGAWRFPVGNARDYSAPGATHESAYRLLRTVGGPDEGTKLHQGADLGCGHGGEIVRAAAAGLVLLATRTVGKSGYGLHVVLAHRLPGGRLAYTIYAHLTPGSVVVRPGQIVPAGARLGRVGRTGRATTSHLHFEVRIAGDASERWESDDVVDPLEFVAARLPAPCGSDTVGRYVEWAQYAGLIDGAPDPGSPLTHAQWWRMLAVATCNGIGALPADASALAESLVAEGVLGNLPAAVAGKPPEWKEITRDLQRAKTVGLRLPVRPLENPGHRRACFIALGGREPTRSIEHTLGRRIDTPSLGEALLAIADLAPPLEKPKPGRARKRKTATPVRPARSDSARVSAGSGP